MNDHLVILIRSFSAFYPNDNWENIREANPFQYELS